MHEHESLTTTRSLATVSERMTRLAAAVSFAILAVAACGSSDTALPPVSTLGDGAAPITLAPSPTTVAAPTSAPPPTAAVAPSSNDAVPVTAMGRATTTDPVELTDEELAAQLWPTALPLPEGFVIDGAQDYPDRGFIDFTLAYTGTGIAEESLWNWKNANLEGVDPTAADGGQNLTYQGGPVEVHQMTDTLFRVILPV